MVNVSTFTTLIATLSIVFGLSGVISMWRKGRTAEAVSILNTALLIIVILLLVFPPRLFT
jgi:hypothetical protein